MKYFLLSEIFAAMAIQDVLKWHFDIVLLILQLCRILRDDILSMTVDTYGLRQIFLIGGSTILYWYEYTERTQRLRDDDSAANP